MSFFFVVLVWVLGLLPAAPTLQNQETHPIQLSDDDETDEVGSWCSILGSDYATIGWPFRFPIRLVESVFVYQRFRIRV